MSHPADYAKRVVFAYKPSQYQTPAYHRSIIITRIIKSIVFDKIFNVLFMLCRISDIYTCRNAFKIIREPLLSGYQFEDDQSAWRLAVYTYHYGRRLFLGSYYVQRILFASYSLKWVWRLRFIFIFSQNIELLQEHDHSIPTSDIDSYVLQYSLIRRQDYYLLIRYYQLSTVQHTAT